MRFCGFGDTLLCLLGAGCVCAAEPQTVRLNNNTTASKTEIVFFMLFPFYLSKTVHCQPRHCLFNQIGDVCTVRCDNRLLLQTFVEIDVLALCNGIFQIVIVI